MRLLTWNLNGLDDFRVDERTEAAIFLAVTGLTLRQLAAGGKQAHRPPNVLVFQEVTERTFKAHLLVHLPRAGYALLPESPPERETFEVIAVRRPGQIVSGRAVPLERSLYGRQLQIAEITDLPGSPDSVRILTGHFDSGSEEGPVRIAEVRQVASEMHSGAVFAGDTNLRIAEWETVASSLAITDAWEALGAPDALKRTWRAGPRGARFDRIWLGSQLRASAMSAIGDRALPGLPDGASDHIGLLVEITAV